MSIGELSKTLKALRLKRGLSLGALARRANTSVATLSRYESGWERFEVYTLQKLATALGCALEMNFKESEAVRHATTLPTVQKKIRRLFWDHPLETADIKRYPIWVAERVIEFGSLEDVQTLVSLWGKKRFLHYVSRARFGSPKTESFWRAILMKEGVTCMKRSFPREQKIS